MEYIISNALVLTCLIALLISLFFIYKIYGTLQSLEQSHERDLENESVHYTMNHDYLTRLEKSEALFSGLAHMIQYAHRNAPPSSLLYIDIDQFKMFNQDYGSACGDYLLTNIADILRKRVRKTDIIARYNNDSFVVVLYNTNIEQASHYAHMLVMKLASTELHYKNES